MECAVAEFAKNLEFFGKYGFDIKTVCQHGNPIVDRKSYSSNRDFFRDSEVAETFDIVDIMVNYRECTGADYIYVSDAGYGWREISDPEHDDIIESKNREIGGMEELLLLLEERNAIVSSHPHRWRRSAAAASVQRALFASAKYAALRLDRIPLMHSLMSRYYHLAKKF